MSRMLRISVTDLMIFVAATAPGFALARTLPAFLTVSGSLTLTQRIRPNGGSSGLTISHRDGGSITPGPTPFEHRLSYWLKHLPYWSGPCLFCWTMAALLLDLRGPKPFLGRMFRQNGVVGLALILATPAVGLECLRHATLIRRMVPKFSNWQPLWGYFWIELPGVAGYTIVVIGLARACAGPRAGPTRPVGPVSWRLLDRLGTRHRCGKVVVSLELLIG